MIFSIGGGGDILAKWWTLEETPKKDVVILVHQIEMKLAETKLVF